MLKVMDREGPCSEAQLSPHPLGAADWDLGWTAGWLAGKKAAVRIKHEQPDQCSMLAIRHSLLLGESTCARPAGLSGIGIDTLGCTEVESELQIGQEREKEKKSQSMWRGGLQFIATVLVCNSVILAKDNIGLQLHLSLRCDLWVLNLQLMTVNDFISPLGLKIFFRFTFKPGCFWPGFYSKVQVEHLTT